MKRVFLLAVAVAVFLNFAYYELAVKANSDKVKRMHQIENILEK